MEGGEGYVYSVVLSLSERNACTQEYDAPFREAENGRFLISDMDEDGDAVSLWLSQGGLW
jgi:hypothetical protein